MAYLLLLTVGIIVYSQGFSGKTLANLHQQNGKFLHLYGQIYGQNASDSGIMAEISPIYLFILYASLLRTILLVFLTELS